MAHTLPQDTMHGDIMHHYQLKLKARCQYSVQKFQLPLCFSNNDITIMSPIEVRVGGPRVSK